MKTYTLDLSATVNLPKPEGAGRARLLIFSIFACVFFVGIFCFRAFLSTYPGHDSLGVLALHSALFAIFAGGLNAFLYTTQISLIQRRLVLSVDDDSLTAKWNGIPWSQSVHKGKVRSIFHVKGSIGRSGIGVSERGQFAARMMGFVFLPEALPEFESFKALVESWRIADQAG